MNLPHPLNVKEQYLYAIATDLKVLIELLSPKEEVKPEIEEEIKSVAKPRTRTKK